MASLPVPASVYFRDFDFDSLMCTISKPSGKELTLKGIPNKEHGRSYISFPLDSDVTPGDTIRCSEGVFLVNSVSVDTYHGEPQILNAFYD